MDVQRPAGHRLVGAQLLLPVRAAWPAAACLLAWIMDCVAAECTLALLRCRFHPLGSALLHDEGSILRSNRIQRLD